MCVKRVHTAANCSQRKHISGNNGGGSQGGQNVPRTGPNKWFFIPEEGESDTKVKDGTTYKFCKKCGRWTSGEIIHDTDGHVSRNTSNSGSNQGGGGSGSGNGSNSNNGGQGGQNGSSGGTGNVSRGNSTGTGLMQLGNLLLSEMPQSNLLSCKFTTVTSNNNVKVNIDFPEFSDENVSFLVMTVLQKVVKRGRQWTLLRVEIHPNWR